MSSPPVAVVTKATIYEHFNASVKKGPLAGLSIAACSFLIVGALIVIIGACLCLTLPGVNVLVDLVYPVILPSILAITLSFPFGIKGYRAYKEIKQHDQEAFDGIIALFDQHGVLDMEEENDQVIFIQNELFDDRWEDQDKYKWLEKIKKYFTSSRGEENLSKTRLVNSIKNVQQEIQRAIRRTHG